MKKRRQNKIRPWMHFSVISSLSKKENGASAQELAVNGEALIKQFMKRFYESALQGEIEHHLGYSKGDKIWRNHRR